MNCAWKELLAILPHWLRPEVDRLAKDSLQEIRLRVKRPVELIGRNARRTIPQRITEGDVQTVINAASRYSPWMASTTARGYLTAPGGHRIGLCGEVTVQGGVMTGFREVTSLNIRVARDFPGICRELGNRKGSVLILGRPGAGKTTLLRDLIRARGEWETVSVVDERGELFPSAGGFLTGTHTDVITGCTKAQGIDAMLRTMGPDTIAVDEITAKEDCDALIQAGWCGVQLLATAHAANREDLFHRPVYKPLLQSGLFDTLVVMRPDKSFDTERITL